MSSLVSKDFKLKYRRSVLGVLWSVLNPLLMMCVLAAVFTNVLKFGDVENYPMYLILGNVLFALMSDSTGSAMGSILESAPLIKKIRVSKMLFPIEKVLFTLVNFAISLIAVVIVMIFFRIAPTVDLVLLPLLLAYMLLFCSGLGLLLSALAVFFRDVCHLWGVVITAWTYAAPFLSGHVVAGMDASGRSVQSHVPLCLLFQGHRHVWNHPGPWRKPHLPGNCLDNLCGWFRCIQSF